MLLRRSAAPKELLEQAGQTEESIRAVALYFEQPSDRQAAAAADAAGNAAALAKAARESLGGLERDTAREDWLAVSRSLADLAEYAQRAVMKAKTLGVVTKGEHWKLSRELRQAAEAFKSALRGRARAEMLVEAKRRASSADTHARRLSRESLEGPNVVADIKERDVLHWLIEAAAAAQETAERLAEVLGRE